MGASVMIDSLRGRLSKGPSNSTIVVFAAIVGLAVSAGGYSGVAVGVGTALAWLTVIALVLGGRWSPRMPSPALARAALLLGALVAFTALSLAWGSDDGSGFADTVLVAGYLGGFVLAGLSLDRGSGRSLLAALAAAALTVAAVALASRLLGLGAGDAELARALPTASGRLSYPIGYWNALGALMALALPPLVHLAAESRASLARALWLAAAGPILLTAYMTLSRGALIAAGLGTAATIWLASERRRPAAALAVAIGGAIPAIAAASVLSGILDSPGTGAPGGPELALLAVVAIEAALVLAFGDAMAGRLARAAVPDRLRPPRTAVAAVLVLAAVGLVAVIGPSRLIDDFQSERGDTRTLASTGILSATGSGRAQFWGAALGAFADSPVHGIGAGGYSDYWNRNGTLGSPAVNAHSEPLELLAELGVFGFIAFVGFIGTLLLAGVRRARAPAAAAPAAAGVGVLVAGSVGFLIDWTWQVPAVVVPILVIGAGLAGPAFESSRGAFGSSSDVRPRSWLPLPPLLRAGGLLVAAVASIWAALVLAASAAELDRSSDALARGDANGAARSARAAAALQPWAAEPWRRLTEVELAVGNLDAAALDARAAIERAPEDFQLWLLYAIVRGGQGDAAASAAAAARALALAPQVLRRVSLVTPALR